MLKGFAVGAAGPGDFGQIVECRRQLGDCRGLPTAPVAERFFQQRPGVRHVVDLAVETAQGRLGPPDLWIVGEHGLLAVLQQALGHANSVLPTAEALIHALQVLAILHLFGRVGRRSSAKRFEDFGRLIPVSAVASASSRCD